ncbi:MAG: hypothetical protein QOJ39_1661 [Candidatus Eremiobacteraeota bacterium]|nr:hypothetical protein [Candidatus Eremiobacteraeota bacterium]
MDAAVDTLSAVGPSAWTPVYVRAGGGAPLVDWALVDGPFTDPFFEQTADRAMQHPFNQVFGRQTGLNDLDAMRASAPGVAPTGFIFHMSRCGSTLISQMLSRLTATIVLSEPQPLDALLRLRPRMRRPQDEDVLVGWLRGMLSALAQPRAGENRLFVKFHAWHVLELPFIARAFPGVPWVFVFREPRAVLQSQERNAGVETFPGNLDPLYLGLDAEAAHALPADEYRARIVAAFCGAALRHAAIGRARFIDYAGLPDTVVSQLLPFFGIDPDDDEMQRVNDVAGINTKASVKALEPFRGGAKGSGGVAADGLAARWLDEPYAALRARAASEASGDRGD